jgi:hypothetical protein
MDSIVIRNSPIHGRGVFASKAIRAGDGIIDWSTCADRLSPEQLAQLPEEERKYVSRIDGGYVLFQPPARFVNHSCTPNARGEKGRDVAARDIAEGEEITVDYVIEQVPGLRLPCACGSAGCRGLLVVPG